jgi:hypothetical protein
MYARRMDVALLSQTSGFWQWRVRRHLQPRHFAALSPAQLLTRYADALGLSVPTLQRHGHECRELRTPTGGALRKRRHLQPDAPPRRADDREHGARPVVGARRSRTCPSSSCRACRSFRTACRPRPSSRACWRRWPRAFSFETFRSPEAGQQRLDALLADGKLVGLQTSVYWLPYFPPNMRFHFNAHNLLVYGKDGDDYLISDPVFEEPVRCASGDLLRARFAKGVLAPKGLMYYPQAIERKAVDAASVTKAIRKTVRNMLAPIPIVGVRGMRTLANRMAAPVGHRHAQRRFHRPPGAHAGRNRHWRGGLSLHLRGLPAGGGALLDKPQLQQMSERLIAIGDGWRAFALKAARMVKGREPVDPAGAGRQAARAGAAGRKPSSDSEDLAKASPSPS